MVIILSCYHNHNQLFLFITILKSFGGNTINLPLSSQSNHNRIVDDEDDKDNGFIIETQSGKDYKIIAGSPKEKRDWILQINSVKRCHRMRERAREHIAHKNYRTV